jgi:enoyl-CoA hydratase/carnithine racemase
MPRQIRIDRRTPASWVATFDHPPINLIDPDTIGELNDLLIELETDAALRVLVLRSADPDFFLAHWDVLADKEKLKAMPPGPTGLPGWPDVLVRLSRAPVVSIAEIAGRARGAGSELVLACDMRFASRERAILGQFEVGAGAVPGGNPMARLAGLVGRGRAMEIIIGAEDVPASLAEAYGYVNRALPDAELRPFVDRLAARIAGFEKQAIVGAKRLLDQASLPPDTAFADALEEFYASSAQPATRARIAALVQQGLQTRSEVELKLGAAVGRL